MVIQISPFPFFCILHSVKVLHFSLFAKKKITTRPGREDAGGRAVQEGICKTSHRKELVEARGVGADRVEIEWEQGVYDLYMEYKAEMPCESTQDFYPE